MDLIEKTLNYKGTETKIFFRELTCGEQLTLARGQKFRRAPGDSGSIEVDLGDQLEKNYKLVQLTLVDAEGKRTYRNMEALLQEPKKKLALLIKLANEAHKDDATDEDEGDAGNA